MAIGNDEKRVVITGLGTVNAVAGDTRAFAAALRRGVCGIGPITLFDTTLFRTHNGAEVKDFRPRDLIPSGVSLKRMSRSDLMALTATFQALSQAGLDPVPEVLREEMGVVIGGGAGGLLEAEAFFQEYLRKAGRAAHFSRLSPVSCAATANHLTTQFNLYGPKATIMTACSSGATAVGLGRDLIRSGSARAMIVGGTEPLCRMTFASFNALSAVDPGYCRPFSGNRAGLTLGEAAGILILESLAGAKERAVRTSSPLSSTRPSTVSMPSPRRTAARRAPRRLISPATGPSWGRGAGSSAWRPGNSRGSAGRRPMPK